MSLPLRVIPETGQSPKLPLERVEQYLENQTFGSLRKSYMTQQQNDTEHDKTVVIKMNCCWCFLKLRIRLNQWFLTGS